MKLKLAETKSWGEMKVGTQVYKVQEIWRNLPKKNYEKEKDPLVKKRLKADLYTEVSKIYQVKTGAKIGRHVIRRCVNSLINKAK